MRGCGLFVLLGVLLLADHLAQTFGTSLDALAFGMAALPLGQGLLGGAVGAAFVGWLWVAVARWLIARQHYTAALSKARDVYEAEGGPLAKWW